MDQSVQVGAIFLEAKSIRFGERSVEDDLKRGCYQGCLLRSTFFSQMKTQPFAETEHQESLNWFVGCIYYEMPLRNLSRSGQVVRYIGWNSETRLDEE
jgi:hypothetical protein